jgi:divalent metal cation (Fe/Co/Zn/Cd) transporter
MSSVIVLGGIAGTAAGFPLVDPLAAGLVAAMVMYTGAEIGWDSLKDLSDVSAEEEVLCTLKRVVATVDDVHSCSRVRARCMGPYTLVDLSIHVHQRTTVSAAQQITKRVRRAIKAGVPGVTEVMVRVELAAPDSGPAWTAAAPGGKKSGGGGATGGFKGGVWEAGSAGGAGAGETEGAEGAEGAGGAEEEDAEAGQSAEAVWQVEVAAHNAAAAACAAGGGWGDAARSAAAERALGDHRSSPSLPPASHKQISRDVQAAALAVGECLGVTHVVVHWLPQSDQTAVELAIVVDKALRVRDAHAIGARVRSAVEQIAHVAEADIHLELDDQERPRAPRAVRREVLREMMWD